MISVEVKLFGNFRSYHPEGEDKSKSFICNLPKDNNTVDNLISTLNIPREEVKIVFVNNIKVKLEDKLQDGDEVGIFPPIAGG